MPPGGASDLVDLLDWRRQIFELYARVRADPDHAAAWQAWRDARDELFARHPQSPLDPTQRESFAGLSYFDYDPAARVLATIEPSEPVPVELPMSVDAAPRFTRFGRATFDLHGRPGSLGVHWLEGYGGGVFVSFTDATSGDSTYGAGRYLLDTVKGADLGMETICSCSTSTSRSTPPAPTTRAGRARSRRRGEPAAVRGHGGRARALIRP